MSTKLPRRQLGTTDLHITRVGFGTWAAGGGGLCVRLGTAGRRSVDRSDESRAGARRQLDRHRPGLWTRPLRGSRRSITQGVQRSRPALRVHKVRARVGPEGSDEGFAAHPEPGVNPSRVRGIAPPTRNRADRSLSVPLAGRHHGNLCRGIVADDGPAAKPRARCGQSVSPISTSRC